jgi:hypothetical protein
VRGPHGAVEQGVAALLVYYAEATLVLEAAGVDAVLV